MTRDRFLSWTVCAALLFSSAGRWSYVTRAVIQDTIPPNGRTFLVRLKVGG